MSRMEEVLARLASAPKDFTWPELVSVARSLGIEVRSNTGSARRLVNPATNTSFYIHQPHPSNILKSYQVRGLIEFLRQEGFLP